MTRSVAISAENNFTKGLVSEGTGLNFPENACTEAENVVFDRTGKVTRRLGIDFEYDYKWHNAVINSSVITEFVWEVAGGASEYSFLVQQIGNVVYFFRMTKDNAASYERMSFTIDLESLKVAGAPLAKGRAVSYSVGKGYLFITHPYCEPMYVSYDTGTGVLSRTSITLKIRDFTGVDDGLAVDNRPASLTTAHQYNLRNQGWLNTPVKGTTFDPLTFFDNNSTVFPSNADIWWTMKNSNEDMDPAFFNTYEYGSSPAPKGYYTINPFNTNRDAVSGLSGLTVRSSSYYRPSTCAFFSGRVFYAGVEFQDYTGEIWFSKIVESAADFGLCHQINDPTSENLSDLLPNDGGVIKILDAGKILALFTTQRALLVFANNGIWAISGSEVTSFKADDYTIQKIATIHIQSTSGLVDVLGTPIFFSTDGIWAVEGNGSSFQLRSLSDDSVKEYLNSFVYSAKLYAKGSYNNEKKIIQWLISSSNPTSIDEQYTYDTIINLDMRTGAFYPFTINSPTQKIKGIFNKFSFAAFNLLSVENGTDPVINGADPVEVFSGDGTFFKDTTKYLVVEQISGTSYRTTYAEEIDTNYVDFARSGVSTAYESNFVSGFKIHGMGNKDFQTNFLTIFCENEANASAYIQGVWDYSVNNLSKKWSIPEQLYLNANSNFSYNIRRVKMRGWGKTLQYRVYSVAGKPFTIIGWSGFETQNDMP
jgi:hypothetical protein